MMAAFARSTPSPWRSGVANFFSLLGPLGLWQDHAGDH
jgi:hypothetical protein